MTSQSRNILLLSMMLQAIAYKSFGQVGPHKTMRFKSPFGSFSMQTPIGWKQIELEPVSSFVGLIAIGGKDTLNFDLGFWSSLLHDGQLLSTASTPNDNKYVPAKKYERKINGYDAFTEMPEETNIHEARIYIDSLYSFYSMGLVVKFDIYGNNLSKVHQKLFYQVIQTIKFKKP